MKRKLKILILLVTFLSLVGGGYYIYRHVYIKHQSEIRFEKYLKKHSDAKPIAHKDLFYDTIRGNYGMIVTYRDEPGVSYEYWITADNTITILIMKDGVEIDKGKHYPK